MTTTLIVPGIGGSGPDHWQTWMQLAIPGAARVAQRDWFNPNLYHWATRIRRAIDRESEPVWIIAHGFGCLAAIEAAADYSGCVAGAMLVAPLDPYKNLHASSLPPQPLDFPSLVVASSNDPLTAIGKSELWADFWSSRFVDIGAVGHINEEAGLGPWPEGLDLFEDLRQGVHAGMFAGEGAFAPHSARAL